MAYNHPHPTASDVIERPSGALSVNPQHAASVPSRRAYIPETSVFYNLEVAAKR